MNISRENEQHLKRVLFLSEMSLQQRTYPVAAVWVTPDGRVWEGRNKVYSQELHLVWHAEVDLIDDGGWELQLINSQDGRLGSLYVSMVPCETCIMLIVRLLSEIAERLDMSVSLEVVFLRGDLIFSGIPLWEELVASRHPEVNLIFIQVPEDHPLVIEGERQWDEWQGMSACVKAGPNELLEDRQCC